MSKTHEPQPGHTHQREATAAAVAKQVNEILFEMRKSFGMYGGANWNVTEVTHDVVAVHFFNWPAKASVIHTATNVRNAMLNMLGDTVPCGHFLAVFSGSDPGSAGPRVELDFYPPEAAELPSQFLVIEENAEPRRQQWRALVDRAAGSDAYFTRTRKVPTT